MSRQTVRTLLYLGFVPVIVMGTLFLWFGVLIHSERLFGRQVSAEGALHAMVIFFMIAVFLPMAHGGAYRWLWHLERKRRSGDLPPGADIPDLGSEPTEPPPRVRISLKQGLVYGLIYAAGAALLLFVYLPLEHHSALHGFIARFSTGRSSGGSLASFLTAWLPLFAGMGVIMVAMERDMKKVRARVLDADETLRVMARFHWLGAYVTAFATTSVLCFIFTALIMRYLA